MSCNICVEKFNKTTREEIKCEYCDFEACMSCCKKYILNNNTPKCMDTTCNRPWTRKFISQVFPKSFINNDLKKHREETLLHQEIALLPETQPYVEELIRKEHITEEINKLNEERVRILMQMSDLRLQLYGRPNHIERREFIRECPDADCRGFLSTAWKCGICEKWTCPTCHEVKGLSRDDPHTCDPNNVATAELLSRDTKPCPKCHTGIFKIDGCNQMWCTQCHTGFDWRTGRIETHIHNPHFFEWQRRNSANGEIPRIDVQNNPYGCRNEQINRMFLTTMIRLINNDDGTATSEMKRAYIDKISNIIRQIIHLRQVEIPNYTPNYEDRNRNLRISYMRNQITKDEFKVLLQRNNKRFEKNRELSNVFELVVNTVQDIVLRIYNVLRTPNMETSFESKFVALEEIQPILQYANECLREISKTYSSKEFRFDEDLRLI
jgi:hypothetical protein